MHYLIGIDVGTQSLRACVFRQDGVKVTEWVEELKTTYPAPRQAEQNPDDWWDAAVKALTNIAQILGDDVEKIVGLSYACTSCTTVVLDEQARPLRPALMWMDERALREAEHITQTNSPVLKYSGGVVSPEWMLPKIAWLLRHERESVERAYRIVEQTDYFTFRLTGQWTLSYQNLVAKWNYANPVGGWPPGFLEAAGVAEVRDKWPEKILPVAAKVGLLRPELAEQVGLPKDIVVAQGGIDSHAGMIGLSVIEPGELGVVMGTSTVLMGQADRPIFADVWGPYPDANIPGTYTIGGGQTTTGSVIQWLVSNFTQLEDGNLAPLLDRLEHEASSVPPGSNGLVALEYFQGNRNPIKDPKARGALWGMTLWHTFPEILRAFYEGIAFGTRHILENLEEHGFEIRRVAVGGGNARSDLMVQILADVCGLRLHRTREPHNTALGAAIWAGLGAGVFRDYKEAVENMVRLQSPVEPELRNKAVYDFYFDKYLRTYSQLKELMHEVVDFEETRLRRSAG
ncbi:MAG: FGGY-family carbohydrate kinase [Anaerolineae bacterium]